MFVFKNYNGGNITLSIYDRGLQEPRVQLVSDMYIHIYGAEKYEILKDIRNYHNIMNSVGNF